MMTETKLRVLDTLSRTIGETHSIRSLAGEVEAYHGTGHYRNVHEQLQELATEGIVSFQKAGRSKVPRLRLNRSDFADRMALLELWRKQMLLENRPATTEAISHLEGTLGGTPHVRSISLAEPHTNLNLRRLEPLILLEDTSHQEQTTGGSDIELGLAKELATLESDTSLRIDPWFLPAHRYGAWLTARDANPAPRILLSQICLWHPQAFWRSIQDSLPPGGGLAPNPPTRLSSLDEAALAWNLSRWGYEEFGGELDDQATPLCPEAASIGALGADRPRWIGAASVILTKAEIEPTLLLYLAKAEGRASQLAGILEILNDRQPDPNLMRTLGLLAAFDIEAAPIEQDMVLDAVELYGG